MMGVTATVATMRSGCVTLVAIYAAVHAPTVAAVLSLDQPNVMAAQNPSNTSEKIVRYTATATLP